MDEKQNIQDGFDSVENIKEETKENEVETGKEVTDTYNTPEGEELQENTETQKEYSAPGYGESYGYTPMGTYNLNNNSPVYYNNNKKPKKNGESHKVGIGVVIISAVLAAVIGAGSSILVFTANKVNISDSATETTSQSSDSVTDLTSTVNSGSGQTITINGDVNDIAQAVYKKCAGAVVGIRTTAYVTGFFGGSTESSGEGSGIVYSSDGYIITNYHVISEAVESSSKSTKIEVFFLSDTSESVKAEMVGYNVSSDLAVIKVDKTGLETIEIGNSDDISVGQTAIAIGSPGGLEFMGSVSSGIISGLNRSISIEDIGTMKVIQTDAAINPGNSGGALLNANGQLIGISSSKIVSSSYEGMGFAIPVNTAVDIVKKIIANQDNPSPYMGIEIYSYGSDFFDAYSLPHGAAVKSVVANAPAAQAGIKAGDIITSFNGVDIDEYQTLFDELDKCKPNDRVTVKLYRSGRYYTTSVTIGSNNGI